MQFGENGSVKVLHWGKDGGPESKVWGFWFIGIKRWFSVVLLRFEDGSRAAYHSHAFDCVSWLLRGRLTEYVKDDRTIFEYEYVPRLRPIRTFRETFHRVVSTGTSWVLTFRGPWKDTWQEYTREDGTYTLTHGRKKIVGGDDLR